MKIIITDVNAIFHVLGNRTLHNATMSDINEYIRLTRKTIDAFEKRIANKQQNAKLS